MGQLQDLKLRNSHSYQRRKERPHVTRKSPRNRANINLDIVIVQYVALRREMAGIFKNISSELLIETPPSLSLAVKAIEKRMIVLFGAIAPPNILEIKRYRSMHSVLFEYLLRHVGEAVPATRFRVLTGDQIHTERRIRELRDLGFTIMATGSSSDADYMLLSPNPNTDIGARVQLKLNLREDKKLPRAQRRELLSVLESLR